MESVAVYANETFAVKRPSTSVTECPEAISSALSYLGLFLLFLNSQREGIKSTLGRFQV